MLRFIPAPILSYLVDLHVQGQAVAKIDRGKNHCVAHTGCGVVEIAYEGMPGWRSEIGQAAHFAGNARLCDHSRGDSPGLNY
jgi:hypothetical protein